jgi:hypothetical protein
MSRSRRLKAGRVALAAAPIVCAVALCASSSGFEQARAEAEAQTAQPPVPTSRSQRLRGPEIICDTPDYQACLDAFARKHGLPPHRPAKASADEAPR